MKIERITFGKTIAMPGYNNDKPEVEAILEPGETLEQALSALNKRLADWHKAEYPNLYQESKPMEGYVKSDFTVPNQAFHVDRTQAEDPLILIQNAPDMVALSSFKLIVSTNQDLYKAYCKRLKELSI